MKNISICYSENATKISYSYCSCHSNRASDQLTPPAVQKNAVTCIYKLRQFLIKLTWCKSFNKGGFSIGIFPVSNSKFSKNIVVIRKERGEETFESSKLRIEVFWDLCRAKYDPGSPEPITGFYIVILMNSELGMIIGDMGQELEVKKRVCDIKVCELSLISRSERFYGKGVYSGRAKFCETGACHEIVIKCWDRTAERGAGLCVYIDKKNVIEVKRLQWNFRGNETMFLDGLLVDFMWDVHDWLFNSDSRNDAVFMFRTRRGLESRLWLDDKKNFGDDEEQEKVGFCFLISAACKNPD